MRPEARATRRPLPALIALSLLILATTRGGSAEGAVRLGEGPELVLHVAGETGLDIEGVRGEVRIRVGRAGQLKFSSKGLETGRKRLPVALWREGRSFRIVPGQGTEETGRRLEVAVPPDFRVTVDGVDSHVTATRLQGPVEISGERLEIRADSLRGGMILDLVGGTARVNDLEGDLTLNGHGLEVETRKVTGRVFGTLQEGSAVVERVKGDVDLDVHASPLTLKGVAGRLRLRASGGEVVVQSLVRGGELVLEDAPLKISNCGGKLRIETDSSVELENNNASLHIDGYGAAVRGRGHQGPVGIKTDGAEVVLERITGPVRIQGEALRVSLDGIKGELEVSASSSDISIGRTAGTVVVENEYGNVTVEDAQERVSVTCRDGDVLLSELNGPVTVDAEGRSVRVIWKTLQGTADSLIRNQDGDVAVQFPDRGGCRVEASAHFGRIETDLPELSVSDDGYRASGALNRQTRPMIRIESAGKVVLTRDPLDEVDPIPEVLVPPEARPEGQVPPGRP